MTEGLVLLQNLLLPEIGLSAERELYVRLEGAAGFSSSEGCIEFGTGGGVRFDTYFNLFSLGKWQQYCDLKDLRLVLEGEGRFEVSVHQMLKEDVSEIIFCEMKTLALSSSLEVNLSDVQTIQKGGILFFELRAFGQARLKSASWKTAQPPVRVPDLVVSITTFRREAAIQRTVDRFEEFIASSFLKNHVHLVVIDNGRSAALTGSDHVTPIENENLGGSGGFTRGLLEARARGASHCLFMDDDASIHLQTLERTWSFLSHAPNPATSVVGALARGSAHWVLWENGATFSSRCYRLHGDLDLRKPENLISLETESVNVPRNFYGGWWFFAFPLDHVDHLPFPFFVRGDDVSFALSHNFEMATLPGVITFQDSDFSDKVSPLTEYLDMRSHLVHHLALPSMDIGRQRTLKIVAWFFARTMSMLHYETLEALNLAIEDVMEGPGFFAENVDMAKRRADIKALTKDETWRSLEGEPVPATATNTRAGRFLTLSMLLTLNGHFIPFFKLFGTEKIIAARNRGQLSLIWGAKRITYIDHENDRAYTVTHSKLKAWKQSRRMLRNAWRFFRSFDDLKKEWQAGYQSMTTEDFWNEKLQLSDPSASSAAVRAVGE